MKKNKTNHVYSLFLVMSLVLSAIVSACNPANSGNNIENTPATTTSNTTEAVTTSSDEKTTESDLPNNVIQSDLSDAKEVIESVYNLQFKDGRTIPPQQDPAMHPENPDITLYDNVSVGRKTYLFTKINDFIGVSTLEKNDDGTFSLIKVDWGNNNIEWERVTDEAGGTHVLLYGNNPGLTYAELVLLVRNGSGEESEIKLELPESEQYILVCDLPDEKSDTHGYKAFDGEGNDLTDSFHELIATKATSFATCISAMG
jgi:hypothetical protein